MAGSGLPLKVQTGPSPIPQISGAGDAAQFEASTFAEVARSASLIGADLRRQSVVDAKKKAVKDFGQQEQQTHDGQLVASPEHKGFLGIKLASDEAYNNMIEALTLERAKTDATDQVVQLRADHFGDVSGFNQALDGWRKGYMEHALPETAPQVHQIIEQTARDGQRAVISDRVQADIKEARSAMDAGIERLTGDAEILLKDGAAPDSPDVKEKLAEIQDRLTTKVNNPLYEYSAEEHGLDADALATRMEVAALTPEVRKAFNKGGYASALEAADTITDALHRDQATTVKIRSALRNEANLLETVENAKQSAQREADAAETKRRKEVGTKLDEAAVRRIYDPEAKAPDRIKAVEAAAPYITGDRFGTLYKLAVKGPNSEGDDGIDYPRLMQLARTGQLTADEAFDQGAGLTGTHLNSILDEVQRHQDKDFKAGDDILKGAFAQSQFEFAPALAASEAEANEELRAWRQRNPEADALVVTQKAREIAARRGRSAAVTMVSDINARTSTTTAPTTKDVTARMQELEDGIDSGTLDEDRAVEEYQQLKEVLRLLELGDGKK
ncbi:MAG: hypothetical protein GC155_06260 [Alphaproteobacteria bacterium]|nr:hypothetical protein [Alphaproteobacteria bacterium]